MGVAALVGVVARQVEGLGVDPEHGGRVVRVDGRLRHGLGEGQVALELLLHEGLVVREDEAAPVAAGRQLRRPGEGARRDVGVVGRLTVGDVEDVGAEARVEVLDRGLVEVAGHRVVDRVVRGRSADLPALGIEQPLAVGVVVDLEREPDPVEQSLHGRRLRLGHRCGAAVGLARPDGRRALLVVAPVVGEVAVEVDAVTGGDLAVAVVVAQVLPPKAFDVERVLVAVGVGHRDEPQLGRLQQRAHGRVVGPPAVDVPVHQPPVDLGGDPLAGVLRRAVEHSRAAPVGDAVGALGQLDGENVAALDGRADLDQLGDLRVGCRGPDELVLDASGLVPGTPHREAASSLCSGELLDGLPALDPRQLRVQALLAQLVTLGRGEDQLDLDPGRTRLAPLVDVMALPGELGQLVGRDDGRVGVEVTATWGAARRRRREPHEERPHHRRDHCEHTQTPHCIPLQF